MASAERSATWMMPLWIGGVPDHNYKVLCGIQLSWTMDGTQDPVKEHQEAMSEIVRIAKARGAQAMISTGFYSKAMGRKQTTPLRLNKQSFQLIRHVE